MEGKIKLLLWHFDYMRVKLGDFCKVGAFQTCVDEVVSGGRLELIASVCFSPMLI